MCAWILSAWVCEFMNLQQVAISEPNAEVWDAHSQLAQKNTTFVFQEFQKDAFDNLKGINIVASVLAVSNKESQKQLLRVAVSTVLLENIKCARTFFNPELHLVPSQVYFCLSLGNHKNFSVVDFQKGSNGKISFGVLWGSHNNRNRGEMRRWSFKLKATRNVQSRTTTTTSTNQINCTNSTKQRQPQQTHLPYQKQKQFH